jgi:hypothetical protein
MADRKAEFDYDIFTINDSLAVWLDITPVFTQPKLEDLLSGLDIYIKMEIRLEQPRMFFFSKKLAALETSLLVSHPLTEDTYNLKILDFPLSIYKFKSQVLLSDFLADSLMFKIAALKQVNESSKIRLSLKIVCKSLSSNALPKRVNGLNNENGSTDSTGVELFMDIFYFFFDVVGYGQDKYKITSPVFRLNELPDLN